MSTREEKTFELLTLLREIDWSEPWLYGVIAFYLFLSLFIYKTRFENGVQLVVFVLLLIIVYIAEDINEYFAKNHRLLTKHQYFDSSGFFISTFMSIPLLLCCAFILSNWLMLSSQLMNNKTIHSAVKPHDD